ncbi:helix-turn-helix domain-containing protein [Streptomyces sp. NL15-2K]|uniref:helix-turn-helix domain-containing protein n=1 Tax=Streptomyces sp. NL15-2K TaxID=376149 RepID=UPI000F57CD1C|nr:MULTISPECIES: XRE family transcriptional regulator [Actinomycetes]WKX12274.1 XRE family transcriptional regulator [Kutzneria buriramensis]GCB46226.1 merR family transcriptional regulator [Streptomyces sp. NL15-2K]
MPPQPANSTSPTAEDADAPLRAELGSAIRKLRKERGLTLVQLADRAALSHPFLSQLERGLTRPSMPSLHRIARALGTTQQALMAAAAVRHPGASADSVHLVRSGEGLPVANPGGTARMLGAPAYSVHPVEYTGTREGFEEYYDHPGDEFVYVVAGEIEIDLQTADGPRLHVLGPGDSICYPGGTPHRWRAVGDGSKVRLLTVQNATGEADRHS